MGVREKVALTIAVIALVQITVGVCSQSSEEQSNESGKQNQKRNVDIETQLPIVVTLGPYVQAIKTKSQQSSERNHETIRKAFNFPDVEYPTESTPGPFQSTAKICSSSTAQLPSDSNSISMKYKHKKNSKYKWPQSSGVTEGFPELGITPKPFCLREKEEFPEVEYPLTASEIWKPNYWNQFINSRSKYELNNNVPNSISQIGCNVKSNSDTSNKSYAKMSMKSAATPKSKLWKNNNSHNLNTTPAPPPQSTSTTPSIDHATPWYIDTEANDKNNSTQAEKKQKKKTMKKATKTSSSSQAKDGDNYVNSTRDMSYMITSPLPSENLFTIMPGNEIPKETLSNLDTCLNNSGDTLPHMHVVPTTPSFYVSSGDVTPVSLTIYDDKMPAVPYDNKCASISDAVNRTVTESTDNKDTCFEDNARNNNKSSTFDDIINNSLLSPCEDLNVFPTVDGEFTTDVFPDFDDYMLSGVNIMTSTLSPINFVTIDEAWNNSEVIDPYKFVSYPDELEQFYIAVP